MRTLFVGVFFVLSTSLMATDVAAPVAGGTNLGVSVAVVQQLAYGWSVKKKVLGKAIFNDKNQKIGKVEDVIIAPDKSVSYAIVSTGGFIGLDKHDVAIPADQIKRESNGKFVLSGATKEALKAMPQFEYAR